MKKPFQRIAALTLSAALAIGCCGGALAADADESDVSTPAVAEDNAASDANTPIVTADDSANDGNTPIYDDAHTIVEFICTWDSTMQASANTLAQFQVDIWSKAPACTVVFANGGTGLLWLSWTPDAADREAFLAGQTKTVRYYAGIKNSSLGYCIDSNATIPTITITANDFYDSNVKYVQAIDADDFYEVFDESATTEAAALETLPKTFTVTLDDDSTETINVTWKLDEQQYHDLGEDYSFTLALPEGYEATGWYSAPRAVVYACTEDKLIMRSVDWKTEMFHLESDSNSIEDITADLNTAFPAIEVYLYNSNGEKASIPVTWTPDEADVTDYLNGNARAIHFSINLPDGYRFYDIMFDDVWVMVSHKYVAPTTPDAGTGTTGTTGDAAAAGSSTVTATSTTNQAGTTAKTATSQTKSPKTADESHALLAVSALALSAATLTCAAVVTKKRKDA